MNAMQRLNRIVKEKGPLIAGLDPDFDKIKQVWITQNEELVADGKLEGDPEKNRTIMGTFCQDYIEAIKESVGVIKINSAFFEAMQMEDLYWNIAMNAQLEGLYVIGDLKRADIGNTSMEYAKAYLDATSPFDAITVNPYFGTDGIKPFLDLAKKNDKGIFVLDKTSNQSSEEIQDLELKDGRKVYEAVADKIKEWGEYTNPRREKYSLVGAVVGATHPEQAKELRERMPNTFFLVPGYGKQGATAKDVAVNVDKKGGGAAINSSRGIMFAYKSDIWKDQYSEEFWDEAAAAEAKRAQTELKRARIKSRKK